MSKESGTNPVTQALLKELDRPDVAEFVSQWDTLEAGLIALYRGQEPQVTPETVRRRLLDMYPRWKDDLARHLPEPPDDSPPDVFEALLSEGYPETRSVSWLVIQLLPEAREALNSWILSLLAEQ